MNNPFYDVAKENENEDIDSENEEKNEINASNMNISDFQLHHYNIKIMPKKSGENIKCDKHYINIII